MTPSLKERLAPIVAEYEPDYGDEQRTLIAFLDRTGQTDRRLQPGDPAPGFELPDQAGQLRTLDDLVAERPLALVFIRGMWCPYCEAQMHALRDAAPLYAAEGVGLAVLTPETGGLAEAMARDIDIPFPVLCDVDSGVALAYGCLFPLPPADRASMLRDEVDLAERYGSGAWFMPLASTFVIGPDGRVQATFGSSDFRTRPEPDAVLSAAVAGLPGAKD